MREYNMIIYNFTFKVLDRDILQKLILFAILLFFCFILTIRKGNAQGFIYSSFERVAVIYNPAYSASHNNMELNAIHRIQTYSGGIRITSNAVSISRPLLNKLKTNRFGGVGLSFSQENTSSDSPYRSLYIAPSLAYNLSIADNQFLSFGLQAAYHQQSLASLDNYITGNQWVSNFGYDPGMHTGENLNTQLAGYFSAGSGFLWYLEDDQQRKKYQFGVSVYNYNKPSTNFTGTNETVPTMLSFQTAARIFEQKKQHLYLEAIGSGDNFRQLYGGGVRWSYFFENQNPFDPITSGEFYAFARYYNEGRMSIGTAVSQKNFSFAFAFDLFNGNQNQNVATEFGLTMSKRINLVKRKTNEITDLGYQLGAERKLGEADKVLQQQKPKVEKVEEAYNTQKVEGNFSFELQVNFNYGFNETALNNEAKKYLKDIYYMLKANPALRLLVTGHTDNVGSRKANKEVSVGRANNVILYLEELGISSERMKAQGKGDKEPLVPNDTEANKAKNRRVEFLIFAEKE